MSELMELYQEVIVDHNRHPHNFHKLPEANRHADGFNPLCGDKLTVYLVVENEKISDASFQGHGCAISTASASLMTDYLKGKTLEEVEIFFHRIHQTLTGQSEVSLEALGKLAVLAGVREFPARVKCATLAWHTVRAALVQDYQTVSTE